LKEFLTNELEKLRPKGLLRELRLVKGLNFSSNNYLGLANDPRVMKASCEAVEKFGAGGTSSRLIAGTLDIHLELEEKLAALKSKEKALVYPSGYQTNVGVISALCNSGDCIIMDRLNHASLWDGARLSGARIFVYPHRDMDGLERILKRTKGYQKKLIITDSVFSMDGDLAPLREIVELAQEHKCWTMVDEAHATGIFGKKGSGLCELLGVESGIDIVMGTLSKALGSQGGFVCGSKELIDFLINRSRAFIYSTALSPASAGAALKALELVETEPERRETLLNNSGLLARNLNIKSASQIIPLFVGDTAKTIELSAKLFEKGIYAPAIRPPTVPENECRLRFSLTFDHTPDDIKKLVDALSLSFPKGSIGNPS
jgi:8-amino-7-oxononanoate synthase